MKYSLWSISAAQLTYTVALGLPLVLALLFVGHGTVQVAWGVVAVAATLFLLLALSARLRQTKHFWSSVEFVLLLSGLFSVLSGLAAFSQSQHAKEQAQLVDDVKEAYVTLLNIGEYVYFTCSGRLPVVGNNPPNACERTGQFLRQIRNERDRPSTVATGQGNRWDLNFCRALPPDGVTEADWEQLCGAAEQLSLRQESVRVHMEGKPTGVFVSALAGRPLGFVLFVTAALFGAKCAKFIYDLHERAKADGK